MLRLIKFLVNEGHGNDAVLACDKGVTNITLTGSHCLKFEQTRDNVEIVFHPMVDLSKKNLFP